MKTPTSLKRLEELIETEEVREVDWSKDTLEWLKYILNALHSRKVYHKKRQILVREQVRLLKEHLSPDELAEVDKQAEQEANEQLGEAANQDSEPTTVEPTEED